MLLWLLFFKTPLSQYGLHCSIHSLCSQHSALLHLCLVQQHCHRCTALPVGGTSCEYQLQRDRAGVSAGSEEQNRPESSVGTRHRHWSVLAWVLQELGWVRHHGRCRGSLSLQPHWLGVDSFVLLHRCHGRRRNMLSVKPVVSCVSASHDDLNEWEMSMF